MGINDKSNNACGKDPDFGAIFMSSSETKKYCLKKGVFGLPSTEIQFVEQIKTGMILFLFEYEKRQLHGVFQASCDGAINIVPNAFSKVGKPFPAQVKVDVIWSCKPLPEKLFRDAIRGNYFSANKFNFGLSENQVYKLLYLFSKRRLEPEAPPGRPLSRTENLKSEWYPLVKVGRSVDHGMCIERVQNEQDMGGHISPVTMHNHQGDSLLYNGELEYTGLNSSDIQQGRAAQFAVDTSEYVSDYLGLKDKSRFTAYENEDYMDCLSPNITGGPNNIGGYSQSPSDKIRNHGEGRSSISDRLMSKSLPETDQRILFSNDVPGLHNFDVNPSGFYNKPILEHNSLVQNRLRPTTMIHPIQSQILNNKCATQGGSNYKSSSLLYDPDVPGLNFSWPSSAGINDGSKTITQHTSPSNNYGRNSLISQPYLIPKELKDTGRWLADGGDLRNSILYSSNRNCMPLNTVQNSDQLASESVVYEDCEIPALSPSVPTPGIGRSSSLLDPFSSLFHSHQSWLGNNFHSTTSQENLSNDITLQKNNDTYNPDISLANEGHFKDGDPLMHEYDIGCYGGSQNNISSYPKKKSSVFSRLSFMQDISKQKTGNSVNEEYDFHTSVDAVMERVRLSQNKWMKKRKPKPMHQKTEILKDKTKINSSRSKGGDCFEITLTDQIMDLTTETGGSTNKTAEETCFVDFKRRSKVRKLGDENEIRCSTERSETNKNLEIGKQKRRRLIRPNFSKSITSDDKGVHLGASQSLQVPSSLESYNVKDVMKSCCVLVQTADNMKADAEVGNVICETHSKGKKSSHTRGCACMEGGERATDALAAFNDTSECLDSIKADAEAQDINQIHSEDSNGSRGYVCGEGGDKATDGAHTALNDDGSKCLKVYVSQADGAHSASASCRDKSCCPLEKGLCLMDSVKSVSLNTQSLHSICQEHHAHKITCAGRGINKEMKKDCSSSFTIEVKDGFEYLQNSDNEKAPAETSCPIKEGLLVMNSSKSTSAGPNALYSICQENHTGRIVSTGRGNNPKKEMSKDADSYFAGVKDGSGCLQNSNNGDLSNATSSSKESLDMTDGKKSVSQSPPSICQECHVDMIRCAGRVIKTEERMLKDGRSSFTEVKNESDDSLNTGNEDNAITPCELHKMA